MSHCFGATLFLVLLLSLVPCLCERMRNIDYLALGYDIYKANPMSTKGGVDPGFQLQKIFGFTYDGHQKSSDDRWDIPDATTVVRENSCSLDFSSSSVSGSDSYSRSLEVYVSGSLEGWGAKFKASVDYKEVEEKTQKYKDLYTASRGECKVYTGKIDGYLPPKLTPNFIRAVNTLTEDYQEKPYMRFISYFGTHFVSQVHMGARFACVTRLSEKSWTSLLQKNIKIEMAASYSAYGVSGALDTRTEEQKKWAREFESVKTDMSLSVIGSKPVKEHGPIEWAQQAIEEPMPMRYTLENISELLGDPYMSPSDVKCDLKKIKANLITALQKYCEYMKAQGMIGSCGKPGPDPPFPKLLNGCRYCAQGCGNSFPVMSGGLNSILKDSFYSYESGCKLPFGVHDNGRTTMLCCQEENEQRTGSCRMCSSCGDQYPENMGSAVIGPNGAKFIDGITYDDGCHGEARIRSGVRPQLCCKKQAACSYCLSCGGEFPEEVGVIKSAKLAFLMFYVQFRGLGNKCAGNASGGVDMAKLCCKTKGAFLKPSE